MDIQTVLSNAWRRRKTRNAFLVRCRLLVGMGLVITLGACASVRTVSPTQTYAPFVMPTTENTATPVPTATQTSIPATNTPSPSLTATPPLSAVAMQGLWDAFSCLTSNLTYASAINLTQFCPGYWNSSSSNMNTLDGVVIRKELVPNLSPLSNMRWKFDSLTDVQKDASLSTTVNTIYTGTLSTTLTADATLKCPSGTPAPFQTSVSIPIQGVARISVYNYINNPQETIQIESWTIQGNPLQDYCSTLP